MLAYRAIRGRERQKIEISRTEVNFGFIRNAR